MARNDIPNGWDKIRQNVQETERLMGQKQYNQSMIKAKQTVEYMVKLQCEQAGIMEGSMDSMIHELYNNGWISKSTAEHYLQIYDIGTKAAKKAITVPTMQTRPTTCCPRRSTPLQTTGKPPAEDARPVAVPSSPETAAPVPGSPEAACSRLIF